MTTNILCYGIYPWSFNKKQTCYKYSKHNSQTFSPGNRGEEGSELGVCRSPRPLAQGWTGVKANMRPGWEKHTLGVEGRWSHWRVNTLEHALGTRNHHRQAGNYKELKRTG